MSFYVLQGDNLNQGAEILRIGEKIVKEISGNYQYPIKMLTPQTGSSITPADNVKTAPKYYEAYIPVNDPTESKDRE